LRNDPGQKWKGGADCQCGHLKMVAEFEGEGFLSWTAQSDKGNGCSRGPYAIGKFSLFLLAEATEL
jgi:hypothetical protein